MMSFFGFRFFLAGFSPQHHHQIKSKIIGEGGVVFDDYRPECTHVVVHNLVYGDPICVSARRDRKTLVTKLWVNQSLLFGEPVSTCDIMYRPLRELSGIPGANKLVICLTGYQGFNREDMKVMVRLMGAKFSKQLVVSKVTHLICYKFEGEKYELAKKMKAIKIVNHHWLKYCLMAWKILPDESYSSKSGYEMDMEAEAKDSSQSVIAIRKSMQPARGHRAQSQVDAKPVNIDEQVVQSIQIINGHSSTSGNAKNLDNLDAENLGSLVGASSKRPLDSDTGNCCPLSSRKTPRPNSLQTAGKFVKPDEKTEENLAEKIVDNVLTFNNLEINESVAV